MNVLICYFSGTGNTELVAQMYARCLSNSCTVTLHDMTSSALPSLEGVDWVGIGYPIHAFNQPALVRNFVKSLPLNSTHKVFIFKVSGEPLALNNASSTLIWRILRKKHTQLLGEIHLLMPYNIMFKHGDRLAKKMYLTTSALVPINVEQLITGSAPTIRASLLAHLMRVLCSIELRGCRLIGKSFHTTSACTGCGKCARNCPLDNITITAKKEVKFNNKCNLCMRCVCNCPVDAINIGLLNHWRVNGTYNYARLLSDDTITTNFTTADTERYYSSYVTYFDYADSTITQYINNLHS
ncbi:MAG: EFR1 family ferrodoxin [Clostridia bacterium]|nr:EFR1 family ferrodoxin [Clostridia bacterium]